MNDLNASGHQLLGATQNVDFGKSLITPDGNQLKPTTFKPGVKNAQNVGNAPTVR